MQLFSGFQALDVWKNLPAADSPGAFLYCIDEHIKGPGHGY